MPGPPAVHPEDTLTLTKHCVRWSIGKMKKLVLNQQAREAQAVPMQFYRSRPAPSTTD